MAETVQCSGIGRGEPRVGWYLQEGLVALRYKLDMNRLRSTETAVWAEATVVGGLEEGAPL